MRLSAIDIKKQEFRKAFKGFDTGEVEAYLDTVANEFETIFRENEELKEKITQLEKGKADLAHEIEIFRDNERTFQKAIVRSQDLAEEIVENATKRAELITKEAEIISTKTRVQAQEEILNLKQELEELRLKNEAIIDDIRNYLIEKLNAIEEYSKNRKIFRLEHNITEHNITDFTGTHDEKDEKPRDFGIDLNIDESK